MCYVPLSVEFLGLTTLPVFKHGSTTPHQFSNQIDASAGMKIGQKRGT